MLDNKTYKEIERALNEERYKEYLLNYPKVIGTEDGALVYNELLRINKILGYEPEKVQKDIDAPRKTHELKIMPKYFDAIINGYKNFEIRKNDRGFKPNDILILREYDQVKKEYTGCKTRCEILYVLEDKDFPQGIQEGYCVMGIKVLGYTDFDETIEGE